MKDSIFQQLQMSQIPSTYSKLSNASAKLSHRRIFPNPPPSHGNDLQRIAAKIRELQDDVRSIFAQNSQVEEENKELVRILEQLQWVVGEQQNRMDQLTQCLRRDVEAGECIAQYEQDLSTVAQQINTLNGLIRTKNEEFEVLKTKKEDEFYENMRLKERSNMLLYTQNTLHQEIDQLLEDEADDQSHTFNEDIDRKAQQALSNCQQLSARVAQLREEVQNNRQTANDKMLVQKERRIRLEYEVRLLKQRKADQNKKEGYLKGFYDEQRIQEVIDDMLQKEDSLRTQIAQQEAAITQATLEWEQELEGKKRQSSRQRTQKEEEIKLLQFQIQILKRQLDECSLNHTQVSRRLQKLQTEGVEMEHIQQDMDGELWQRIRVTEEENSRLQRQFQQITSEVLFLQRQMTL